MKITIKLPKPRNPFALAARQKKAGAHDKTEKTRRRDARQALQRAIREARGDAPLFLRPFFPGDDKIGLSLPLLSI